MRKYLICITCLLSLHLTVLCQQFPIEDLADSLTGEASAVYRHDELNFTVETIGMGHSELRQVVSVLTKDGISYAKIRVGYNDLRKLKSLVLIVYNEEGEEIRKFSKRDFMDMTAFDGVSIYSDNRLKYLDISHFPVPFTYELRYEVIHDGLMFYPSFSFQSSRSPIEYSVFRVSMPPAMDLRYHLVNMPEPVIEENEVRMYTWEMTDQPTIKREPFGPSYDELIPKVITAPSQFEIEGYTGNMSSWAGLGQFQRALFQDLEELSPERKAEIRKLVAGVGDPAEKVRIIYEHLQSRARYVSVQLGIGGWQPFSPAYVDENGYGDCKALTYYTKSMLETVGVESDYTLVHARDRLDLFDDFSVSRFNHVILSVPLESDTLWLECTNQIVPAGYLGSFTGDREVLVINENDARVVRTPVLEASDNLQIRNVIAKMDKEGNVLASITSRYTGIQHENDDINWMVNNNLVEQEKWVYQHFDIPNFEVENFEFAYDKQKIPEVRLQTDLKIRKYGTVAGKRVFFSPNLISQWTYVPKDVADRKTEVVINTPYVDVDTVQFELPVELSPEILVEPISFESRFGSYSSGVFSQEVGRLTYIRRMTMRQGRYEPSAYQELIDFFKKVAEADGTKVVL